MSCPGCRPCRNCQLTPKIVGSKLVAKLYAPKKKKEEKLTPRQVGLPRYSFDAIHMCPTLGVVRAVQCRGQHYLFTSSDLYADCFGVFKV